MRNQMSKNLTMDAIHKNLLDTMKFQHNEVNIEVGYHVKIIKIAQKHIL